MTRDGGARPAANRPGTDSSVDRFVMVPVDVLPYVADGKISATAAWLYVVLLSHHNRTRADDDVWPSRRALADALGLSRTKAGTKTVDKYLTELRDAGLIAVEKRTRLTDEGKTVHLNNRYTLMLTAKSDTPKAQETLKVVPKQGLPSPQTGTRGSPQTGTRGSPQTGTRTRRSELDESEPDEMNNTLAPRASRGTPDDESQVVEAEIVDSDDSPPRDTTDPTARYRAEVARREERDRLARIERTMQIARDATAKRKATASRPGAVSA